MALSFGCLFMFGQSPRVCQPQICVDFEMLNHRLVLLNCPARMFGEEWLSRHGGMDGAACGSDAGWSSVSGPNTLLVGAESRLRYLLSEHQPNVNSTMSATRMIAVPRGRKKPVMAPSGCVRVVMTITIGVAAWVVSIFASVLVSCGCPIFVAVLIRALLALLVSMFILTVLRVKAEWSQAGHRKSAEGK